MQLTPFQIGSLVVGSFIAIVGLNILGKYKSDEDFRTQLSAVSPTDWIKVRTQRVAEENMEPISVPSDENESDDEA